MGLAWTQNGSVTSDFYLSRNLTTIDALINNTALENQSQLIAWFAISSSLAFLAGLTNTFLLIAVVLDRTSDICTRLLIGGLALASLLYTTLCQFLGTLSSFLQTSYGYTCTMPCMFYYVPLSWLITGISWTDVGIAVNRIIAIRFPHHYNKLRTTKAGVTFLLVTWSYPTFAVALTLSRRFGVGYVKTNDGGCVVTSWTIGGNLLTYSTVVLPYVLTFTMSLMVLSRIFQRLTNGRVGNESLGRRQSVTKRLGIAKALLVSVIWCIICIVPFNIFVSQFTDVLRKHPFVLKWLRTLSILQYGVNPLIYLTMSNAYRNNLKRLFLQRHRFAGRVNVRSTGTT